MGIQIRVKNEIAYGDMIKHTNIYDFIKNLEELEKKTKIKFIYSINNESDYIELFYSKFIEAYNKVNNHTQDIQGLYQEAFNQPVCIKQDLIIIEYF